MRKAIISTLTLMFICYAFISSAFLISESIIFNSDFTIQKKHIHFSHHVFKLNEKGKGIITITNNTPHKKITGGFVIFNKKRIKFGKKFWENGLVLEREIRLHKTNRNKKISKIMTTLRAKYRGYWNYYGVIGN